MADEGTADDPLFRLYERLIGEPEEEAEVYLGFGLFFAGVACALIGLALFVAGAGLYGLRTDGYFALAQPGYLLGMLSVPLALLAVVVLLPTERRVRLGGLAGTVIAGVAAVGFLLSYPEQWFEFGTRNTLLVVGTYAVGVALLTAVTGSALVAHRLERAQPAGPAAVDAEAAASAGGEAGDGETVTDEEVQADIDEAMSEVELTWGGVERDDNRELSFREDYVDESVDELDVEAETTVDPGGVDSEVEGLKQLKGGEQNVATSESTVDDETAALADLKERRRREELPVDEEDDGAVDRLRAWLFE